MKETFKASNGIELRATESGLLERRNCSERGTGVWDEVCGIDTKSPALVWDALREFFQHERDQELGRWRWSGDQKWVVYKGVSYLVINEERGTATYLPLAGWSDAGTDPAHRAVLAAYEAAHPEPKPWHDAKPGEVWLLTVAHEEIPVLKDEDDFYSTKSGNRVIRYNSDEITSGRRIWPEVSDA